MSQQSGHHLQPNSSVQTSGRIGVSGHVGENGFVNAADVPDGFQVNIELVVSDEGKSEVVLLQDHTHISTGASPCLFFLLSRQ